MNTIATDELARRATWADRAAPRAEADALWAALIAAAPDHPRALFALGRSRIDQGDPQGALELLSRAELGDPTYAEIPFFAALAHRKLGNLPAAIAAIDRALAIDAYFFLAQLSKGSLYEQMGRKKAAAQTYKNAIKIAPAPEHLPRSQRAAFEHAKSAVAAYSVDLAEHLRGDVAALRARCSESGMNRFDESLEILAGVKPRQVHDPLLFYYPRLPAIPFYERTLFPWLAQLEAATDAIRAELDIVLREDWDKFAPYIQLPPEAPVNQWVELNHSSLWSTLFLWRDGVRQDQVCAKCPNTAALLEQLPLAKQTGFAPTVVFSVLSPNTRIPPHTGSTNVRLLTHLPLILPPNCGFRVGNDTREWRMGEAWVFDDTIEHEAWNDSGEPRAIMIFDVWNPLLSAAERELVAAMMLAFQRFNAEE
ncbi:MAG: aspartyl/asparaginyl beta-hydroxylase domain-containing protein [Terricaulis sp.]